MPQTRVKICGITRPEDATVAAEFGVDMIGLNFVGGPRMISKEQGLIIYHHAHKNDRPHNWVHVVALVNADTEPPGLARALGTSDGPFSYPANDFQVYSSNYGRHKQNLHRINFWMVVPIKSREDIVNLQVTLAVEKLSPAHVIFDTAHDTKLGGTGQSFNWNWIAEARAAGELNGLPPIILAGGLTPDNVAEAIRIAKPYAVDVSSGVEVPGKPGIKDPIKLRDFIQAAKNAI